MPSRYLLILALALTACGKNSASNSTPAKARTEATKSLSEMTVTEALRTKYESAVLRCFVATSLEQPIPGQARATTSVSDLTQINLLSETLSFPRELHLQAGTSDHHYMQVTLKLKKLELANGRLIQADGTQYRFANSPSIEGEAVTLTEYWPTRESGPVRGCGETPVLIHERVESAFSDAKTSTDKPSESTATFKAACVIDAKAKPGYENEFVREN